MKASVSKLTEEQVRQIKRLVEQGYSDKEIANHFGNVTDGSIFYWRKKLGIKTSFSYEKISKADHSELVSLFNQGLSDYKIAQRLGIKPCSVFNYRKRHNIGLDRNLKYGKAVPLSHEHQEILFGIMMGDGSMRRDYTNARFVCMHGIKQRLYCEHKQQLFAEYGAKLRVHKRNKIDNRTGICYEDVTVSFPANPELNLFYEAFYSSGKKDIPVFLLQEYYTEKAMAFQYMDDGSKNKNGGYSIATESFSNKSIVDFVAFLRTRFGIKASIHKKGNIYIKKESANLFKSLIEPYFINDMKYKL